jgi:hypothetical protein
MAHAACVRSTLNYTLDNGVTPNYFFYEPEPGTVKNPPGTDTREVAIHNAWDRADQFSVDREGFAFKPCGISFTRFDDSNAVRTEFFGEVAKFMCEQLGARRVHVFDHNIRSKTTKQEDGVAAAPVRLVHSDYTVKSGPQRLRELLPDEADELSKRRYAFLNFWKPIRRKVEELPLAVCDVTSTVPEDMIRLMLCYKDRTGEIYAMRHSPSHRWNYFPGMQTDQALLLKCYDSETDGRARFMAHSAFEDPTSAPDAPTRESIEVRTIALF